MLSCRRYILYRWVKHSKIQDKQFIALYFIFSVCCTPCNINSFNSFNSYNKHTFIWYQGHQMERLPEQEQAHTPRDSHPHQQQQQQRGHRPQTASITDGQRTRNYDLYRRAPNRCRRAREWTRIRRHIWAGWEQSTPNICLKNESDGTRKVETRQAATTVPTAQSAALASSVRDD